MDSAMCVTVLLLTTCGSGWQTTVKLMQLQPSIVIYQINSAKSQLMVKVSKEGFLSAFGHDHDIAATRITGNVRLDTQTPANSSIELTVEAGSLEVRDREVSEKDRERISSDMKSTKVLDVARYPLIRFVSARFILASRLDENLEGTLEGDLTLHGVTRRISIPVKVVITVSSLRTHGLVALNQTDFGITPIRVALGGVKVKDQVRITFDLYSEQPTGR